MCIAEARPISTAEASELFSDLGHWPALVLAVSGGPDSTALMTLAARWVGSRKRKPKLIAVTIDHGLRKESRREVLAVAKLARKLGIAHRVFRWRGKKPVTGLQEAARAARYRLLAQAAQESGARAILTAHTLDDQAETVLIRMSRGSGLTGLGAMKREAPLPTAQRAPSSPEGEYWGGGGKIMTELAKLPPSRRALCVDLPRKVGGKRASGPAAELLIVRPLLDIRKARLIATLKAAKIPFAEDPFNRDPRFTRVRLRNLMPALAEEGLDAPRLALLARRLARADAAIEAAVERAIDELAVSRTETAVAFDAAGFARLPAEVGLRIIGRAVASVGGEGPPQLAKLETLKAALDSAQSAGNGRFRRSLAGALVGLPQGRIVVERAPPRRGRTLTKHRRRQARIGKAR